jgi:hypothetical protein
LRSAGPPCTVKGREGRGCADHHLRHVRVRCPRGRRVVRRQLHGRRRRRGGRLGPRGTQTIPDSQCVQDILNDTGYSYTAGWEAQGQVEGYLQGEFPQYTFVDDMWTAYRSMY